MSMRLSRLTGITRDMLEAALRNDQQLHPKMYPPLGAVAETAKFLFERECSALSRPADPQEAWDRMKPDARISHLQLTVRLFARYDAMQFRVIKQKRGGPQRE